jgi:hypothetical protein
MRCKVSCSSITPAGKTPEDGYYMSFSPVYTGSEENKDFFKWTPGGTVQFNVMNVAAASKFEQGKEYYLDFTPAK